MPRTGPRRENVVFRLGAAGIEHLDERAIAEGLVKADGKPNRSELLRLLVQYALWKMPPNWRPPKEQR